MISIAHKFPMRTHFYAWKKNSLIQKSAHLLLHVAKSTNPRVAVIIPKKAIKTQVLRVRARRMLIDRLFELSREAQLDGILFIKSASSPESLLLELDDIFIRLHV